MSANIPIYLPLGSGHYLEIVVQLRDRVLATLRIMYADLPKDIINGKATPVYKAEYWTYLNGKDYFETIEAAQRFDFGKWGSEEDY